MLNDFITHRQRRHPIGRITRRARRRLLRLSRLSVMAIAMTCVGTVALAEQAYGGAPSSVEQVTVHSGDTLWGIASSLYGGDDAGTNVATIMEINHLSSADVQPGEVLTVPAP